MLYFLPKVFEFLQWAFSREIRVCNLVFSFHVDTLPPQPVTYVNDHVPMNEMTPLVTERPKKKRRSTSQRAPRSKKIKVEEQPQEVKPEPAQVSRRFFFFFFTSHLPSAAAVHPGSCTRQFQRHGQRGAGFAPYN